MCQVIIYQWTTIPLFGFFFYCFGFTVFFVGNVGPSVFPLARLVWYSLRLTTAAADKDIRFGWDYWCTKNVYKHVYTYLKDTLYIYICMKKLLVKYDPILLVSNEDLFFDQQYGTTRIRNQYRFLKTILFCSKRIKSKIQ